MNITEYLLTPEHAKWAKERGFDVGCCAFIEPNYGAIRFGSSESSFIETKNTDKQNNDSRNYLSLPTFDQFFDWVEEKWGIILCDGIYKDNDGGKTVWVKIIATNVGEYGEDFTIMAEWIEGTKRAARIAAVEAIIIYINENEL